MKKGAKKSLNTQGSKERKTRGRQRQDAAFPVPPASGELPESYAATLGEIKARIRTERLRVVMAANAAMVLLYWDIGKAILERQKNEGWGAKVIDRLSADLREAFPDMKGLSPRNLLFMRSFAEAYPDQQIVKQLVSQFALGSQYSFLLARVHVCNLNPLCLYPSKSCKLIYAVALPNHGFRLQT